MAILISRYERRDSADRDTMARAALDVCRANRAADGMRSARFYWINSDTLALMFDAESAEAFDRPPSPDQARTGFALADLARNVGIERWIDAGVGEQAHRAAGRWDWGWRPPVRARVSIDSGGAGLAQPGTAR